MDWGFFSKTLSLVVLLPSCSGGPSFFKQSGRDVAPVVAIGETPSILLATEESNGSVKATVQPNAELTQVMKASSTGNISGTSVAFPPGSLAIATEITISEGQNLSSDAVLKPLALGTEIAAAGAAVEILSSVAMDTARPFVLALGLPPDSGLKLTDSLANLIVIYRVRLAETNEQVTGIIPRSDIIVKDGQAQVQTRHFGSFQTVLTRDLVSEAKQVPTPVVALTSRRYFIAGPASTSFGAGQTADGLQAWALHFSPAKVGDATSLQVGASSVAATNE